MKEAKSPKKPLIFYYGVVLAVLLAFNMIVSPLLLERQVTEVDYGTFMRMIDDKDIGEVQMDDSEILFSNKAGDAVYKTVALQDSTLVQRLYEAGAKFSGTVEKTMSPLLSLLLTGVLPLLVFVALGQFLSRKLIEQAGGKNAMSFGMGKSNAKVYVQSSQGIHFSDVAGEDEAKESLAEIVDYLHNPQKYTEVGASMPKGVLLVGPQAPVKPCWPRLSRARPTCPSSPSPARNLWKCSWVWAQARCAICSSRPRKRRPASCLSMKSTPSARSATAATWAATTSASRP